MGLKHVYIPEYVTFLYHWIYELKRIYDDAKDDDPKFWLTSNKNERINIFSNTMTKMVLKTLNFENPESIND